MSRMNCRIAALAIFMIEVLIALYVHDDLVRPWGGDVLVVVSDIVAYTLGIMLVVGGEVMTNKRQVV